MAKMRTRNFLVIISISLFLSGCGYKFLGSSKTKVFVSPVINQSFRPLADIYLANALRDVFIEYPEYQLVKHPEDAEYTLNVKINKWDRSPLFFSGEKTREIVVARFLIEAEVVLLGNDKVVFTDMIAESVPVSLGKDYNEERILEDISKNLASKIYFLLVERR